MNILSENIIFWLYICLSLYQEGFAPNGTLHSQKKAQDARFGYAMAVAPDLNHDGYSDLLVGAPLEDDHQGALYIYHGDEYYIIPQYKQVNISLVHVCNQPQVYQSVD